MASKAPIHVPTLLQRVRLPRHWHAAVDDDGDPYFIKFDSL